MSRRVWGVCGGECVEAGVWRRVYGGRIGARCLAGRVFDTLLLQQVRVVGEPLDAAVPLCVASTSTTSPDTTIRLYYYTSAPVPRQRRRLQATACSDILLYDYTSIAV